jgi:hypothetical protein
MIQRRYASRFWLSCVFVRCGIYVAAHNRINAIDLCLRPFASKGARWSYGAAPVGADAVGFLQGPMASLKSQGTEP